MLELSKYTGTVSRQSLAFGSKSQRTGFVLRTVDGHTFALEVEGWGPFKQEVFVPFEGHPCHVEAARAGNRLLAQKIQALDDPSMQWSLTYARVRSCPFCGRSLPDTVNGYCPNCGSRIS